MNQLVPVAGVDPSRVNTPADLATCLDGLRRRRNLSYEAMERAAGNLSPQPGGLRWEPLAKTTVGEIVTGKRLPTEGKLRTFLAVCTVARADLAQWLAAWERAVTAELAAPKLGKPIDEYTAFGLEVHPSIEIVGGVELPILPTYVPRSHDARLAEVVDKALMGYSSVAMLVGDSSTGKTRACWEAVQRLRATRWRLWHPIYPSRPDAAAAELPKIESYMVLWLNDAQHYLLPGNTESGERIAAGLRDLLLDAKRGPVLVLGTMWPEPWATLTTTPPPGVHDPYAQARALLADAAIHVPDTFVGNEIAQLRRAARSDPRLALAASHADGGRITQYLAGVHELSRRYRTAPAGARAIIHVAMDARRVGLSTLIPRDLLALSGPGYLADVDWNNAGDNWLDEALAYTSAPCHGTPGPLTPIKPRPAQRDDTDRYCQLADYLEQVGRIERAGLFPPESFWNALVAVSADPHAIFWLGVHAEARGRYRLATQLLQVAADRGDRDALLVLAQLRAETGDLTEAEVFAVAAADRGDPGGLRELAMTLETKNPSRAEALYRQAADRGDDHALWKLGNICAARGDGAGAKAWYQQAADRGHPYAKNSLRVLRQYLAQVANLEAVCRQAVENGVSNALPDLLDMRENAGDPTDATAVAIAAADRGDMSGLLYLARLRENAGNRAGAKKIYQQAADRGNTLALCELAKLYEKDDDVAASTELYRQAAQRRDSNAVQILVDRLERMGDRAGAESVAIDAGDRGDYYGLRVLARIRERAGDRTSAERLYRQSANHGDAHAQRQLTRLRDASDGDRTYHEEAQAAETGGVSAVRALIRRWDEAGSWDAAESLALRAADRGDVDVLGELAAKRARTWDLAGAEALYLHALDRGNSLALNGLAHTLEEAGAWSEADQLRRFGINDDEAAAPRSRPSGSSAGGLQPSSG
jgi:TPR repeat protein